MNWYWPAGGYFMDPTAIHASYAYHPWNVASLQGFNTVRDLTQNVVIRNEESALPILAGSCAHNVRYDPSTSAITSEISQARKNKHGDQGTRHIKEKKKPDVPVKTEHLEHTESKPQSDYVPHQSEIGFSRIREERSPLNVKSEDASLAE